MADPLGLISNAGGTGGVVPRRSPGLEGDQGGASFKDALFEQIKKVNEMQQNAAKAVEDVFTGERDDIEGVMNATLEADTAFRLLLQVRNKVMDAYEEVKQIRI